MTFKLNISEKTGKTYKLEAEAEALLEKALHDKVDGIEISPDLKGYEFEIAGASDKSGFTVMKDVEGIGLKRVLLTYGKAMKRKPRREGKKKASNPKPKGLRLRKTVRGKIISREISQINLKTLKEGPKKLSEVFPDQNKPKESEQKIEQPAETQEATPLGGQGVEAPVPEAPKEEQKIEEKAQKTKQEEKSPETPKPKQETSQSPDTVNNSNKSSEPKESEQSQEAPAKESKEDKKEETPKE